MATYRNPWFKPMGHDPEIYKTDVKPVEYRGYQIYQRIKGVCWDVVKNGVARTQRCGLEGGKGYIDAVLDHDAECDCTFCGINRIHRPELHQREAVAA